MAPLRRVLLAFTSSWAVTGCCASRSWLFGAAEQHPADWEYERRDHEIDHGEIAAEVKLQVEHRVARIKDALPPSARNNLDGLIVDVLRPQLAFFRFESGFERETRAPLIRTSVESVIGLAKVSMAQQVGQLVDKEGEWLNNYLLYVRAVPDGAPIVDPLRAIGLIAPNGTPHKSLSRAKFETLDQGAKQLYDEMLTFLVAHEVAHLVLPRPGQGPLESEASYNARSQLDEARADREAIEYLAAIEAKQPAENTQKTVPLYLLGAPLIFFQWIVTMQGARHSLSPTTHPLDHVRALAVVDQLASVVDSLPLLPEERTGIKAAIGEARREIAAIEKQGPAAYSADLDRAAQAVTLESLRRFH